MRYKKIYLDFKCYKYIIENIYYLRALARIDRHRAAVVICAGAVDVVLPALVLPAFPAWLPEAYCEKLETSARRKRNAIDPKTQRN